LTTLGGLGYSAVVTVNHEFMQRIDYDQYNKTVLSF